MARRGLEPKPGCRLWTSRLQRRSIKSLKSRECRVGAGRALGPPPRSSQCRPCIWQDLLEQFCLVRADQNRPFGSGLWAIQMQPQTSARLVTGSVTCVLRLRTRANWCQPVQNGEMPCGLLKNTLLPGCSPWCNPQFWPGTRRQHIASGRNRWGYAANRASNGFGDTTKTLPQRVQFWSQLATYGQR